MLIQEQQQQPLDLSVRNTLDSENCLDLSARPRKQSTETVCAQDYTTVSPVVSNYFDIPSFDNDVPMDLTQQNQTSTQFFNQKPLSRQYSLPSFQAADAKAFLQSVSSGASPTRSSSAPTNSTGSTTQSDHMSPQQHDRFRFSQSEVSKCHTAWASEHESRGYNACERTESPKRHQGFACDGCHVSHSTLETYYDHLVHHNKQYRCHLCSKGYKQVRAFRAHLLTHEGNDSFICDLCGKCLSTPEDYMAHLKVHGRKDLHVCQYCKKYFRDSCTLQTHMWIHTGEKPYKCDTCGKAFRQSGTLSRHMKVHAPQSI